MVNIRTHKIKESEQNILNQTFDEDFNVMATELVEFDGEKLVRKESPTRQTKIVESGGYTYICKAPVGISESQAKWQIYRIDSTGNKMYADANPNYDNVATDPTILSYSYS